MEAIVKNNQSLIDIAIEALGSAELALDIALLNGISLTDVLEPGTSLLLPDAKPATSTSTVPVVATVTEASLLQLLTAHSAIMGGAVAGHVRNGGDVKIDNEGRMWVELLSDNPDWDSIDNKPLSFPPAAHTHQNLVSPFESGIGPLSIMAMGHEGYANGDKSLTIGFESEANGEGAIAIGYQNVVNALGAVAIGSSNLLQAGAQNSTAFGSNNIAIGIGSMVWGYANTSHDLGQTTFGVWSKTSEGDPFVFNNKNSALVIGNGIDEGNRSNAFDVDFNGNTYMAGNLRNGMGAKSYNNFMKSMCYNSANGQTGKCLLYANNVQGDLTELYLDEENGLLKFPKGRVVSAKIKVIGVGITGMTGIANINISFIVDQHQTVKMIESTKEYILNDLAMDITVCDNHSNFSIFTNKGIETANYIALVEWLEAIIQY